MKRFGTVLQSRRKECGLTLKALAKKSGLVKGYIRCIETGAVAPPSIQVISALSKALKTDVRELAFHAWAEKTPSIVRRKAVGMFERWLSSGKSKTDPKLLHKKPVMGDIFRASRRHLGLTKRALAAKAGVDPSNFSFIEIGRFDTPSVQTLKLMVRVLGLKNDLLPLVLLGAVNKGPNLIQKELVAGFLDVYGNWADEIPQEPARRRPLYKSSTRRRKSNKFGKMIREARQRLKLPQKELGEKLGVTQGWVSGMESGKKPPPIKGALLKGLSKVLRLDLKEIRKLVAEGRR